VGKPGFPTPLREGAALPNPPAGGGMGEPGSPMFALEGDRVCPVSDRTHAVEGCGEASSPRISLFSPAAARRPGATRNARNGSWRTCGPPPLLARRRPRQLYGLCIHTPLSPAPAGFASPSRGLMVFEYIIRSRPRRRPSHPLAEGFSPTASPAERMNFSKTISRTASPVYRIHCSKTMELTKQPGYAAGACYAVVNYGMVK